MPQGIKSGKACTRFRGNKKIIRKGCVAMLFLEDANRDRGLNSIKTYKEHIS